MKLRKTQTQKEPSIPIRRLADALADGQTAGLSTPLSDTPRNPHLMLTFGAEYLTTPWLHRMWMFGFDKGRAQRIADLQIACSEIACSGAEGDPA